MKIQSLSHYRILRQRKVRDIPFYFVIFHVDSYLISLAKFKTKSGDISVLAFTTEDDKRILWYNPSDGSTHIVNCTYKGVL